MTARRSPTGALACALVVVTACTESNPAYRRGSQAGAVDAIEAGAPSPDAPVASTADGAREARGAEVAPAERPRDATGGEVVGGDTAGGLEYHTLECEQGTLAGAMVRGGDARAFGGAFVHVPAAPADWTWNPAAPTLPPDRVELPLRLARGGTYVVWVRFWGVGPTQDAWFAGFDRADMRRFYSDSYAAWAWVKSYGPTEPDKLRFTGLAAGPHTLVLGRAEAGPRCDRVIVTNDLQVVPTAAP